MMIHSPCNTISSYARFLLLDALEVKGLSCLKSLIHTLDYTSSLESYGSFDKLQLVINLIGLTCLSSLPEYQSCIIESKGIKAIALLVKQCLSNDIHVERRETSLLICTQHSRKGLVAILIKKIGKVPMFSYFIVCWDCLKFFVSVTFYKIILSNILERWQILELS